MPVDQGGLGEHGRIGRERELRPGEVLVLLHRETLLHEVAIRGARELAEPERVRERFREREQLRPLELVDELGADDALRCAVDGLRDDGARERRVEVDLLDVIGYGAVGRQQEPRAHRDAVRAVGERSCETTTVVHATGDEHRDVDCVEHLGDEDRCGYHAGVAAALGTLRDDRVDAPRRDLLRVTPRPDGGHDHHTRVLQLLHHRLARCLRERRDAHLDLDDVIDARVDVDRVGAQVHAERLVGRGLHLGNGLLHLREGHGCRGHDAEPARVRCGRSELGIGHPTHAGLHDRVADAEQRRDAGLEARIVDHLNSALRAPLGSMTVRSISSSASVGRRVVGMSPSITSAKVVASTTCSTVTPGCVDTSRMRLSGVR